jgi:hypothetical protein
VFQALVQISAFIFARFIFIKMNVHFALGLRPLSIGRNQHGI